MSPAWTRRAALAAGALGLIGCARSAPQSYLHLQIDEEGRPPSNPYVVEAHRGGKSVMLLGVVHSRNPADPMFQAMDARLSAFQPDLIIHEGVLPSPATDRASAISQNGDLGYVAHVSRRDGVPVVSGDLPETEEFPILAAELGPDIALVLLVSQRLLVGLNGDLEVAEQEYAGFYSDHLIAFGFPQQGRHATWEGFRETFTRVQGFQLEPASWDPEFTSPLVERWPLNAASRRSHHLRDARLIETIRSSLDENDRVGVVFGAWHVMAVEPLLAQIVSLKA